MHLWTPSTAKTALDDIPSMTISDSSYIEQRLADGDFVVPAGFIGYVDGYLSPTVNGSFQIQLTGDENALCKCKISNTTDPTDAVSKHCI